MARPHTRQLLVASNGGGLMGTAGAVHISGDNAFFGNSVVSGGRGANLHIPGTIVSVFFPVLPGHWLPNSRCLVYRGACPPCTPLTSTEAGVDRCAGPSSDSNAAEDSNRKITFASTNAP